MPRRTGGSRCNSLSGDGDGNTDREGPSASGRSKKYAHNSCFEGKVIAVVSTEPSVSVYNSVLVRCELGQRRYREIFK